MNRAESMAATLDDPPRHDRPSLALHSVNQAPQVSEADCKHGGQNFELGPIEERTTAGTLATAASLPQPEDACESRASASEHRASSRRQNIWDSTPELAHIRDMAHARIMAPAAVLGAVLAYRIAEVPPNIQLPPIVGEPQSLNLFCALSGESGDGKSASETLARELLGTLGVPWTPVVASGEKLAGMFATPNQKSPGGIRFTRRAAVLCYDEVTALASMAQRSGSTLFSWILSAWPGKPLGAATQNRDRCHPIPAHSYRLCLLVGVQPQNARELLAKEADGLPQRFLWVPTIDPALATGNDELVLADIRPIPGLIDIPRPELNGDPISLDPVRYVEVCETAQREIRALRRKKHARQISAGEAHRALLREKVAAGLSLLRPGVDMPVVDEDAWSLAGELLAELHDPTLRRTADEQSRQERRRVQHLGRLDDQRAAATEATACRRVAKVLESRMTKGGLTRTEANRAVASRDKKAGYLDLAIAALVESGQWRCDESATPKRWFRCGD